MFRKFTLLDRNHGRVAAPLQEIEQYPAAAEANIATINRAWQVHRTTELDAGAAHLQAA
ncbi:MAG: hypothetical protein ACXU8N_07975 [Telluria sp.]